MSNKQYFSYKGYTGSIELSTEDMCLFGKVQMVRDLIMYDGENLTELKESFESAVDDYLGMCEEEGKSPDKPCSGTFNVRMSEELHRKSINEANFLGISLNAFISKSIEHYFKEHSLKEEFSLINPKELSEHLTEIKSYYVMKQFKRSYDYSFAFDMPPIVVSRDPINKHNSEGVEDV